MFAWGFIIIIKAVDENINVDMNNKTDDREWICLFNKAVTICVACIKFLNLLKKNVRNMYAVQKHL